MERSMSRWVLGVVMLLVGCKQDSGLLPVDNKDNAPAAQAQPQAQPMAQGTLPAGHPPIGDMPAGHPAVEGATAGDGGPTVSGIIDVEPALAKQVKAGDVIFVIARTAAGQMAAVQKLTAPDKFPVTFTLTGNGPMAMGPLSGSIKISARVDKDGDAMSKNPGDVIGEVPELVNVPSQNVKLLLNKTL